MYEQITSGLKPLAWRLRWRTSIELGTRLAWLALAAAALVLALARLVPLENYQLLAGGILGGACAAWLGYSLMHRRTPFQVARRADDELALRDRLATALQLADPNAPHPTGIHPDLAARQLDDALAHLRRIEPRAAFRPRIERRSLAAALLALLVLAALVLVPNPMDAVIAERREIAQTAQEQAKNLDELAKAVEQNQNLNPQKREQLVQKLRALAAQLRSNPGDAKQALADLSQFQDVMRASLNVNSTAQAAALEALAQQMAQLAHAPDTPQNGEELAQLLEQLAANPNALSEAERAALAQALAQAASQVAAGDPSLAGALSELAQHIEQNASRDALQNAVTEAANALQNAAEQQAFQQALAQSLHQADAAQRALGQAGQQAQANQSGQGQGQAQGQAQGQGQGQGQGNQLGGGGGTNANTLPGGVRTGRASDPTQPNKSFATDDANMVYSPFEVGQGEQEQVQGQDSGGGQTTTRRSQSQLPGARNPARVPYSQVFQQYAEIAGQAMERSYIPAGLRDYVKEYFSELEP